MNNIIILFLNTVKFTIRITHYSPAVATLPSIACAPLIEGSPEQCTYEVMLAERANVKQRTTSPDRNYPHKFPDAFKQRVCSAYNNQSY